MTADIGTAVAAVTSTAFAASVLANRDYRLSVTADAVALMDRLVALVSTLAGLGGVVGGLAGAIGGLGAAGVSLGAATLVLLAVGDAIGALSAQQDLSVATSRAAAKQQEQHTRQVNSAYRQVESAAKRAALARTHAAKSAERAEVDGARSVAAAFRQLLDSQRALTDLIDDACGPAGDSTALPIGNQAEQARRGSRPALAELRQAISPHESAAHGDRIRKSRDKCMRFLVSSCSE